MAYSDYITSEDLKDKGIDLAAQLGKMGYSDIDTAVNDFLLDAYNSIYRIVRKRRGIIVANQIFDDFIETDNQTAYPNMYACLVEAIQTQAEFMFHNGYSKMSANYDVNKMPYSEDAFNALVDGGIISYGW